MAHDPRTTAVLLSATRTPIGKFLGGLAALSAPKLGALVVREAVRRAGVADTDIDEVILGHVLQGGGGQASARQAMIAAGLPGTIPALTINKVCGSGLKAVMLGAQAIKAGDAQVVVAGGMESMSNAPFYVFGLRNGVKFGHQQLVDGLIHDGLWCSFGNCHMGSHAEYTAQKAQVSRADQDQFAYESHQKAVAQAQRQSARIQNMRFIRLPQPAFGPGCAPASRLGALHAASPAALPLAAAPGRGMRFGRHSESGHRALDAVRAACLSVHLCIVAQWRGIPTLLYVRMPAASGNP